MFPLRDSVKPERAPAFNWLLVLANAAVFLYMVSVLPDVQAQQAFVERWGLVPAVARSAFAHPSLLFEVPGPFLREGIAPFFTHMFLHGGLLHVVGTLWFLIVFGDNVEGRLGHAKYLVFYVACGLIAAMLHIALVPTGVGGVPIAPDRLPMVGASGAIAGVLGAYVVMFPRARIHTWLFFFFFEVSAFVFLAFWFAMQFWSMNKSATSPSGEVAPHSLVAYWAHIGGFLAGVLFGLLAPRPPSRDRVLWRSG